MNKLLALAAILTSACLANAQSVLLDNFNNPGATGAVLTGTSWVTAGNVTFTNSNTTITVGNTAKDDNGWGFDGSAISAAGMNFLAITAQVDAGNVATSLVIGFSDSGLNTDTYSINMSSFTSTLTTVYIPLAWTNLTPTDIVHWDIGGGTTGSSAFKMTFGNLAFSATGAPVPEPATYAAVAGILALGAVAYRRRQQAA